MSPTHRQAQLNLQRLTYIGRLKTGRKCYLVMYEGSHCIEVMGMCGRMAGEEFSYHCVMKSVKHRGGGIMVWGCIHSTGIGFFDKCEREA